MLLYPCMQELCNNTKNTWCPTFYSSEETEFQAASEISKHTFKKGAWVLGIQIFSEVAIGITVVYNYTVLYLDINSVIQTCGF